jgi:hypothetical protein
MLTVSRASLWLAGTITLLAAAGCSAPTINGFKITAGPSTATVTAGSSTYINVAATTGASSPVTAAVIVYNLPVGVSSSPASPTVTTGATQTTITISAAPNAQPGTVPLQITGYAGLASSNAYVNLTVVAAP